VTLTLTLEWVIWHIFLIHDLYRYTKFHSNHKNFLSIDGQTYKHQDQLY